MLIARGVQSSSRGLYHQEIALSSEPARELLGLHRSTAQALTQHFRILSVTQQKTLLCLSGRSHNPGQ